jgi:hypothetical protein
MVAILRRCKLYECCVGLHGRMSFAAMTLWAARLAVDHGGLLNLAGLFGVVHCQNMMQLTSLAWQHGARGFLCG